MSLLSIPRTAANVPVKGRIRRAPPADLMQMDRQTYRDLEVFEADGMSLFELLNRTRTNGGEKALDARLRRPWSNAEKIRAVQDSLRFVIAHRAHFDAIPGESMISSIEHYLGCGLSVANVRNKAEAVVEAIALRVTDVRGQWILESGVNRMLRLLQSLRQLAFIAAFDEAPGELGAMLHEMRELLAHPPVANMPAGDEPLRFYEPVRLDRVIRLDERAAIERLMRLMFDIDALVAMADTIRATGFVLPEILEGPSLELRAEGLYHPFVKNAVPNALGVNQDQRLLFLTGPNMAGKTTYLRAAGTATYLAHIGMGVPARSFAFTPCDTIITAITVVDNVREGVSFFRAEAMRVRTIAQALADGKRVIALLDEPFMGTNVKDALDVSRAVLLRLAAADDSLFLVSSHLMELGDTLLSTEHVLCSRFEARDEEGRLQFDYILRPGVSEQRLGLRVLQQEGVFTLLERRGE